MAISIPSPTPTPPSPDVPKTNTIIIASLPPPFFHPRVQQALRIHFEFFGQIHTWAPLTGLGRIMVVYWTEEAVEGAKELDGSVIGEDTREFCTLRVYRALPTPLIHPTSLPSHTHLAPPALEKNFLISPPGSPPIGWEQITEDPPNAAPLASDLLAALEKLQLNRGCSPRDGDGRAELIRAEEVNGGVGVWVEYAERGVGEREGGVTIAGMEAQGDEDGEWYYPPPLPRVVPRTAMPPMTT